MCFEGCYFENVVSKQLRASYLLKRSLLFSSSFRCFYLTIDLVRIPIVGCEGTSAGQSYSHRRQLVRRFSNFRKRLDRFIEGNIEGLRSFFIEGSLLKRPIFEGHDCISEATSEVTLEVRVWKVCLIQVILSLKLGYLAIDFESCHALLITIQYKENSKLQKLNFYAITELSGMGVQIYKWEWINAIKCPNRQTIQPD